MNAIAMYQGAGSIRRHSLRKMITGTTVAGAMALALAGCGSGASHGGGGSGGSGGGGGGTPTTAPSTGGTSF